MFFFDYQSMDFSNYQTEAGKTAIYPREAKLVYPMIGLAGEVGEVAEHIKKAIRDDNGMISQTRRNAIMKELGDVLWYVSAIATDLGADLNTIACDNIEKLKAREAQGKLHGAGSDREAVDSPQEGERPLAAPPGPGHGTSIALTEAELEAGMDGGPHVGLR